MYQMGQRTYGQALTITARQTPWCRFEKMFVVRYHRKHGYPKILLCGVQKKTALSTEYSNRPLESPQCAICNVLFHRGAAGYGYSPPWFRQNIQFSFQPVPRQETGRGLFRDVQCFGKCLVGGDEANQSGISGLSACAESGGFAGGFGDIDPSGDSESTGCQRKRQVPGVS